MVETEVHRWAGEGGVRWGSGHRVSEVLALVRLPGLTHLRQWSARTGRVDLLEGKESAPDKVDLGVPMVGHETCLKADNAHGKGRVACLKSLTCTRGRASSRVWMRGKVSMAGRPPDQACNAGLTLAVLQKLIVGWSPMTERIRDRDWRGV